MIGGILNSVGNAIFGGPKEAPTMSASQLGFSQTDFDEQKKRRADYIDRFEGKGGYADRAEALGQGYSGFLDQTLGAVGDDGMRSGGLYDQLLGSIGPDGRTRSGGLYDEYLGTVDPIVTDPVTGMTTGTGLRTGGVRGEYADLRDKSGDMGFLMKDREFFQGLAEAQRSAQDRANQEMLRRGLANESAADRSGMLTRFRAMSDPLGEQRAADALRAANMSMQNRQGMLGQQGQFLGQETTMLDRGAGLFDRGANLFNQGGNFLSGQSAMLGQEADFGTMGYQDAIAQMNQMDQARLAAAGMDFQGKMGAFNAPTGADKLLSAATSAGTLMSGIGAIK